MKPDHGLGLDDLEMQYDIFDGEYKVKAKK